MQRLSPQLISLHCGQMFVNKRHRLKRPEAAPDQASLEKAGTTADDWDALRWLAASGQGQGQCAPMWRHLPHWPVNCVYYVAKKCGGGASEQGRWPLFVAGRRGLWRHASTLVLMHSPGIRALSSPCLLLPIYSSNNLHIKPTTLNFNTPINQLTHLNPPRCVSPPLPPLSSPPALPTPRSTPSSPRSPLL